MKIKIDIDIMVLDVNGLESYLLNQEFIKRVSITSEDLLTEIKIDFKKRVTQELVMYGFKCIKLYLQQYYNHIMLSFDKGIDYKTKKIKYVVDDMCCEWCYKMFVEKIFSNSSIKSVQSNFELDEPAFNIEFIIEYDATLEEKSIIKFLDDNN